MAFVALKPCRFAGQSFTVGAAVPEELILPGRVDSLVSMGILAAQGSSTAPAANPVADNPTTIPVLIRDVTSAEGLKGDVQLDITPEGLQQIFDAMMSNAEKAEAIIKEMTDAQALIILDLSDSRKTIKKAAEERGKELCASEDAGEA